MFDIFKPIKGYLYAIGAFIVVVFIAVFKYRGIRIEALKEDLDAAEHNAVVVDKAIKAERKVTAYEADNRVEATKAEVEAHKEEFLETHDEDPSSKFYNL